MQNKAYHSFDRRLRVVEYHATPPDYTFQKPTAKRGRPPIDFQCALRPANVLRRGGVRMVWGYEYAPGKSQELMKLDRCLRCKSFYWRSERPPVEKKKPGEEKRRPCKCQDADGQAQKVDVTQAAAAATPPPPSPSPPAAAAAASATAAVAAPKAQRGRNGTRETPLRSSSRPSSSRHSSSHSPGAVSLSSSPSAGGLRMSWIPLS
ncbi:unnamed protein product [Vitrella brassicaformis CCMP3155]|uniref:Uncharacterized protein n=1 Tax=Vitrella brassicaformis (strain CCMP3155) TaxID=1169540 RepID=A0A0G4ETF2_VITBC|nr:unnamed protein product [Vitrella brassicaformis CCMP3155]|mmetsp:Transcript_22381/g.55163  ORF Transcript_22381/g.55163 Transcript_22381/m.55163 type:complete len:206 (-) Transcript_22381:771-1388(-)|eukprot:CEM01522.1 unnamed protein product [Vitrella brassicaformis CCMP3155]